MTGWPNQWTDERKEWLRELFAKGLTYKDIACVMHMGRNSISGMVDRMGLSSGKPKQKKPRPPRPVVSPPSPESHTVPAVEQCDGIHLTELTLSTCRFPMWGFDQDPTFIHCGKPAKPHRVYCAEHCDKCYQKPQSHHRKVEIA